MIKYSEDWLTKWYKCWLTTTKILTKWLSTYANYDRNVKLLKESEMKRWITVNPNVKVEEQGS